MLKSIIACLIIGFTPAAFAHSASPLSKSGATNGGTFNRPTARSRPMVRLWFPDAGAGASKAGLSLVAKRIRGLAAGGFGGAEIAFLSDNTNYGNDDARTIGFGSKNWQRILKQILRTANSIPGGFTIDLTLSSHWPVAVNNIDPNDDAQQQQMTHAYVKITAADLAGGVVSLPLPKQRTRDTARGLGSKRELQADFLFVNKFAAATIVKVVGFNGKAPIFGIASLVDVTPQTRKVTVSDRAAAAGTPYHSVDGVKYAGYAAGIPDRKYAAAHGIDYAEVLKQWGPEPNPATLKGKFDADGNRKRMADWQYEYQTRLGKVAALKGYHPSKGPGLAKGDYVLFGSYAQGNGEVMSGGASITEYNRPYVVNLYNRAGVQAVKDFWNKHILDGEMVTLLKENSARFPTDSLFEDSLEVNHTAPFFASGLFKRVSLAYGFDAAKYAPVYSLYTGDTFGAAPPSSGASGAAPPGAASAGAPKMPMRASNAPTAPAPTFDNQLKAKRIVEDFYTTLGKMYDVNHIEGIKKWAATFGYTYKAQTEGGAAGIHGATPGLGVQESDSDQGDAIRNIAGAANLSGTNLVSEEALTWEAKDYTTTWLDVLAPLNGNLGDGVNRVNLHGSPFQKTFNNYRDAWPGWVFGFMGSGFGAFDGRQVWWKDMNQFSDYVARNQAVLQGGHAKVDLAVLQGTDAGYALGLEGGAGAAGSNNVFQQLLDAGYSYNVIDEQMLGLPGVGVADGILAPGGPAYKALIVFRATELTVAGVGRLIGYAKAGLPIVLYRCKIKRVYGTDTARNNDKLLTERVAQLTALKNVARVDSENGLKTRLSDLDILPAAGYAAPGLQVLRRASHGRNYYFFYNAGTSIDIAAAAGDSGIHLTSTEGLKPGDRLIIGLGANRETVTIASIPAPAPAKPAPNVLLTEPLTKSHAGVAVRANMMGPAGSGISGTPVSAVVDKKVTLSGRGVPYLLDSWTGMTTPIAQYTSGNGTVTIPMSLVSRDTEIVRLGERRLRAANRPHVTKVSGGEVRYTSGGKLVHRAVKPGTYEVSFPTGSRRIRVDAVPKPISLSNGWGVSLESWGPDPAADASDPSISKKTTVTFKDVTLGKWADLPASARQLKKLGVPGMNKVIGVGTYTKKFDLPASWTDRVGATLQLAHNTDMVVAVTVNGHRLGVIDQFTDTLDAGKYLHAGKNTITVVIDTTMANRIKDRKNESYGLGGVTVIPYVETEL